MMRRPAGWLLAALLLPACANRSPERLFNEARTELRRGNLSEALAKADLGCRRFQGRPESPFHWHFRLLKAEIHLAQGRPKDALSVLEGNAQPGSLAARQRMHQGYARYLLADLAGARRLLDDAASMAGEDGDPALLAELAMRRGTVLAQQGATGEAELLFRRAGQAAKRASDRYLEAAALGNLGFNLLNNARFDEAIPWFEQALKASEAAGAKKFVASTLGNLGRCYLRLGDYDRAVRLTERAEAMAAQMGNLYGRQAWLGSLGEVHHHRGDLQRASSCFRQAAAIARQIGDLNFVVLWLNNLTDTHLAAGDLAAAGQSNEEALRLCRSAELSKPHVWSLFQSGRIAAASGQPGRAEAAFNSVMTMSRKTGERDGFWSAAAELAEIHAGRGSGAKADQKFRQALEALEERRAGLARDEWKLSFHSGTIRFYQRYVDFLMSRGASERALEIAESSRARLLLQKLGLGQPGSGLIPASRFRKAAASMNAVLVSFWVAPRRSFAWVVRPEGVSAFVLPAASELARLADAYERAIRSLRDPLETGNAAGEQLYKVVIGPMARLIPPGSKVVLVPDGCLHGLNLETLPVPGATPRYWIEDAAVALTPSLTVLASREGRPPETPEPLLLIGDPVPPSDEFPPLPHVRREIESIRARFGGLVLTGKAAHPGVYRESQPGRFGLIHFSAHATGNSESPLDSAVILSPGGESFKLYARDVMGIPIQARLVTISACRGAGARLYSGEGLVGFAWAFLQAGAHNVIAGLWEVSDDSTAALMDRLYQDLARGRPPAAALREAKLALLRSGSGWRKPYYWGPFQIFSRFFVSG